MHVASLVLYNAVLYASPRHREMDDMLAEDAMHSMLLLSWIEIVTAIFFACQAVERTAHQLILRVRPNDGAAVSSYRWLNRLATLLSLVSGRE